MSAPLPALPLVMPNVEISNKVPLAASIARALDLEGGVTFHTEIVGEGAAHTLHHNVATNATPAAADLTTAATVAVKPELPESGPTATTEWRRGAREQFDSGRGSRVPGSSAISAIVMLRATISNAVENERTRLVMARYEVGKPPGLICRRLAEERDPLKIIDRKVAEKSGSHDRAAMQYQRARDMLNDAKFGINLAATKEQKNANQSVAKTCDELVEAWVQNVGVAYARLESWELKQNQQKERVASVLAELNAAENLQKQKQAILDNSLRHLQALDAWLAILWVTLTNCWT
ncbi:hypothetical protein M758_UG148500 [Ceratodon purpureus]|nr:hypothetical protein M758_UG148500 [Ceratodon purpureus]